ncbi:hypothetical protein NIES4071_50300 [Calothrix sp. NIES-4071]|nr:hypothetical protein NIES4071_50300 [Calothrix sp. NIES-4071]BAZ59337.1 hypothetical protein NIES4105_50240 [Calothrix sp. NIES-4105]
MKTAEKLASFWLLTLGFMFLSISSAALLEKKATEQLVPPPINDNISEPANPSSGGFVDNSAANSTAVAGIVFGVPSTVLGGWLALSLYRRNKQEKKALQQQTSERLQSIFYRMVQENQGRVTLLGFAMQSQLPPANAKDYLDNRAREFNANFKISEEGSVSYHFDI